MASQVEIINRALLKLGSSRITALTDTSKSAQVMSALYDTVLFSELRKSFWNFALARTSLPALADAPTWGYAYQYQLPSDFLRLVQVSDFAIPPSMNDYVSTDTSAYAIEGGKLLTDYSAPLKIRYVQKVTDPGLYDPLFVECMATRLAYESCEEMTGANTKKADLATEYRAVKQEAIATNAIEKPSVAILDDSWVMARLN